VYRDSLGIWTIGVGRNIVDRGLSDLEVEMLLNHDIDQAVQDVHAVFGAKFQTFAEPRQAALLNMMFNLGLNRFSKFVRMIAAIREEKWEAAARCALDSLWAKQVGKRSERIAKMLREGVCGDG
jgi:lysozyme